MTKAIKGFSVTPPPSLPEHLRRLINNLRGATVAEPHKPRIPIWLQLSVAAMIILGVSIGVLSYVVMERQKGNLYDHIIKLGTVSLNYVAENAKVPMLTGDTLTLNTLVNNVVSVEGHFYAFIVDNDGTIKAHTDHEKIDKQFEPFQNLAETFRTGKVTYFDYTIPGQGQALDLSMPIVFQKKKLGVVHVGLSKDFFRGLFIDERAFLTWATLNIIVLGVLVAVLFSLRFTRPVSSLVQATAEIARGNYEYRVGLKRNDELGTLATAFNRMAAELHRQSLIRESFGKYVGAEVLEMIAQRPGQNWLAGQTNHASILIADIRGFTAYAEGRKPEEVVEKLNEFFAIATDVVLRHGGFVDKFIGDAVLAVFGVPVALHDHKQRCIQAALDLQEKLAAVGGNGNQLLHRIGIGIASGLVVAGNIGSQVKMEYTVIGDCVNVAAYINTLAGAGEIVICSDTADDFPESLHVEPLKAQKIKGREGVVQAFRVTSAANRLC